jgi:hypothetical protein
MGSSPDAEELEPVLKDVADASQTHFIMIDGFDECHKADRDVVLAVLHRVMLSSRAVIKVFFASREDIGRDIQKTFKTCYRGTMNCQEAHADLTSYIEEIIMEKVDQGDLVVSNSELICDIQDALVRGACGMLVFLM